MRINDTSGLKSDLKVERRELKSLINWVMDLKCNQQQLFCQCYSQTRKDCLGGLVGLVLLTSRYFNHMISARLAVLCLMILK